VGPGPMRGARLVWDRERAAFRLGGPLEGTPQGFAAEAGLSR